MSADVKFPLTNQALFDLANGEIARFPMTFEEYGEILGKAEYRADYHDHQMIASMSYESQEHSELTSRLSYLLQTLFYNRPDFIVHNSNRPVCIPDCDFAVFNPDGSVVSRPGALYEFRPGMNAECAPVLIFEVLSKNTRAYDFGEKLPCYKKIPGLRYLMYVETDRPEALFMERLESTGQWLETRLTRREDTFAIFDKTFALGDLYG